MRFRIADVPRDAPLIARLADTCWRAHYTAIIGAAQVDYMLETIQSEGAIIRDILDGRHYRIIEDDAGSPLGYLAYDLRPTHVFLSKLYILPGIQRRGIGQVAINQLTRDHPQHAICLTVNKHNHQAISFYHKAGFVNTGSVVADIGGGFVMDDWKMEKSPTNYRNKTL